MRWLPKAIPILIGVIVLEFTLVFGIEAIRILSSPISGLDKPAFAHVIYALGKLASLGPSGHVLLATLLGGVYLAIAVMCGLHLASRVRAVRGGSVSHELLDAALILVVVSTLFIATPAILQGANEFLIQERLPLWLVGLAATMSMIERLPEADDQRPAGFCERKLSHLFAPKKEDEATIVAPAFRAGGENARWHDLRADAGMKMAAEPVENGAPWFAPR